jgi:hypothetical protein
MRSGIWIGPLLLLLGACAPGPASRSEPAAAAETTGRLVGSITLGPGCPAESAAEDCRDVPADGARLLVRRPDDGTVAARVEAAADGRYGVDLPAGRYLVELDPRGIEMTKDLPAETEIVAGRETRLDVRIDSGIR